MLKNEKRAQMAAKKREVLLYSGALKNSGVGRPPLFGLPTVYCADTEQFMCAWCNKHALRAKDRKGLVRYVIPLVSIFPVRTCCFVSSLGGAAAFAPLPAEPVSGPLSKVGAGVRALGT